MEDDAVSREPPRLVEHFFRHESAHLVSVLARAFGLRHLDLIEDMVQEAMIVAMETWRHGLPDNPSGWLYRVARNRVFDALRRDKIYQRALSLAGQAPEAVEDSVDDWLLEERLPDSLLRMMFVCCHPTLDRRSQIALTLKILCAFSLHEIARGLLISDEAAKKRVQRAKKSLADRQVAVELPPEAELERRLAAVHDVLYVLFNEGYSASKGRAPVRNDICEEAARLCHLLCGHEELANADSRALLALMLSHSARLEARVDHVGATVLLADQDRAGWDRRLMTHAEFWMERSATSSPSRFHFEAAISLTHCRALTFEDTDWQRIVELYDGLLTLVDSPIYVLNRAIARSEGGDIETARIELEALRDRPELRDYVWLDCAMARLHELRSDSSAAAAVYSHVLQRADLPLHQRSVIERRLAAVRN